MHSNYTYKKDSQKLSRECALNFNFDFGSIWSQLTRCMKKINDELTEKKGEFTRPEKVVDRKILSTNSVIEKKDIASKPEI